MRVCVSKVSDAIVCAVGALSLPSRIIGALSVAPQGFVNVSLDPAALMARVASLLPGARHHFCLLSSPFLPFFLLPGDGLYFFLFLTCIDFQAFFFSKEANERKKQRRQFHSF